MPKEGHNEHNNSKQVSRFEKLVTQFPLEQVS
jgi:hypothetical protein